MKVLWTIIGLALGVLPLQAQTQMKDVFRTMPDSLQLLLTANDKMDLLDFKENNMKAQVNNRLDGKSTLDSLTTDYLYLTVTEKSFMEMKLVPLSDGQQGVLMAYSVAGPAIDTQLSLYTLDWRYVPVADYVQLPDELAYLVKPVEEMTDEEQTVLRHLDPLLTEIRLSVDSNKLICTRSILVLGRDDRKIAESLLKSVEVAFVPQ